MNWGVITNKINKEIGGNMTNITNKMLLDYYLNKNKSARIYINDVKRQHIIYYDQTYYRLYESSADKIKIFKILVDDDKILFDFRAGCENKELLKKDNKILTVIYIQTAIFMGNSTAENVSCNGPIIICEAGKLFHGTDYALPIKSSVMPYNYFGNWYTPGLSPYDKVIPGESTLYMINDYARMYQYAIKTGKIMNLFYFDENIYNNDDDSKNLNYVFAFIAYFDIKLEYNRNGLQILFDNKYAALESNGTYGKYDYTRFKNLINNNGNRTPFTSNSYNVINPPSNGDGDKPLAAKICETTNNGTKNDLKIDGWIFKSMNHFLNCRINSLENVGAWLPYKDDTSHVKKIIDSIIPIDQQIAEPYGNKYIFLPKSRYEEYDRMVDAECAMLPNAELNKCLMYKMISLVPPDQPQQAQQAQQAQQPQTAGNANNIFQKYEIERMKHMKYKAKYLDLKNKQKK